MHEIYVGVFTGVITACLGIVAKSFWTNTLVPWFVSLKYKGVVLDGAWTFVATGKMNIPEGATESPGDYLLKSRLVLSQSALDVKGNCTVEFTDIHQSFILDFIVKGYIFEGYLVLTMKPSDRRVTSCACSLLKIAGGGTHLLGLFNFRNANTESASQIEINFERVQNIRLGSS